MKLKELFEETSNIKALLAQWKEKAKEKHIPIQFVSIYKDNSIIAADFIIHDFMLDENNELAIKMNDAQSITISADAAIKLKSFKNFPIIINGGGENMYDFMALNNNNKISSFENFPKYIKGTTNLCLLRKLNYSKIDQYTDIDGNLIINYQYKGPVLSLLNLSALRRISLGGHGATATQSDWSNIINKYLKQQDRDILSCKEELINAGYKEYAKL